MAIFSMTWITRKLGIGTGKGSYTPVHPDDEDGKSIRYRNDSQHDIDGLASMMGQEDCNTKALEKSVRRLRALVAFLLVAFITILLVFLSNLTSSHSSAKYRQLEWSGLLGEDSNGFVPNGVGQPLQPTYFGPDHPYYLPEDTYYDLNKSLAYVKKIKALHNSSSVLVNRHYAKRIHPDGHVSGLAPFFTWKEHGEGRQIYTLRGFHHMHCLIVVAEEFAYRIHNQSKWTEPHIAHCVNTLRDAIQCLADAQPISFVNGYGVGQVTDDQAVMCRDWSALRAWGNDPVRGLRITNNAPPGVAWENITEILPYPELTEMELRGLE